MNRTNSESPLIIHMIFFELNNLNLDKVANPSIINYIIKEMKGK